MLLRTRGIYESGGCQKKDWYSKSLIRAFFAKNVDNLVDNPVDNYVYYSVGNLLKTRELECLHVKLLRVP